MSNANIQEYQNRLRDALAAIAQLKSKLESAQRAKNEPIAIIGMGCRFPGGGVNPDAYFRAIEAGVDGVRAVPEERWPIDMLPEDMPGPRWAGLLDSISDFDSRFFEIAPREAVSLDPQQRLLLEISWEALEDAGVKPDRLKGSRTGVFVGLSTLDYQQRCFAQSLERLDAYAVTGTMPSTAAGRISFVFGLQGPCMIVDTACSSSLVAMHLACQSLRLGEVDLALAGGVNAILMPLGSFLMARLNALSPDGRCKTFDARANGYVRGEGCGMIVLKRLSDAERDDDRILAMIRGSGVNQDGRSTGLTTPNVLAQEDVIKQALANARLNGQEIGYIEAHGTGTPLGDPIEIDALRNVLGSPRPDGMPCVLGAVKTNIGHLEAAAGVAGVIKTVQVLRRERIPRNLHFQVRNPRIDLEGTALTIPTGNTPWPRKSKPRYAGVSSFGISGTNAHIILEEAPAQKRKDVHQEPSVYLLPLSAKTPEVLPEFARAYAELLKNNSDVEFSDIVYTASLRRTHHEHRISAVAQSREQLAHILDAFARGDAPAGLFRRYTQPSNAARIVFIFSGQGSQWAGMAKTLYEQEPIFRAKLDEIAAIAQVHTTFSIVNELVAPENQSHLDETEIVQPALFAIQVAFVALLDSWGIIPSAVIGHSVGEVAAAYVSGAISLTDAVRLVTLRGRTMQKATGHGKMVWISLPANEVAEIIKGNEDKLSIAAVNDPGTAVLSGETKALDAIVESLNKRGIVARPLRVNYAFHSPQMEPLARELVTTLGRIDANVSTLPMYSTVMGKRIDGNALISEYWGVNVFATVNFAAAVGAALDDGFRIFAEIAPHPVLLANVQQCAAARNAIVNAIPTLRRKKDERIAMLEAVGAFYAEGVHIDWQKIYPKGGRVVSLPTYPWRRERYWLDAPRTAKQAEASTNGHPLLGFGISLASEPRTRVWEQLLRAEDLPFVANYRVHGATVLPISVYVEMVLAAATTVYGEVPLYLEDLSFDRARSLSADATLGVQLTMVFVGTQRASVIILGRTNDVSDWQRNVVGLVGIAATTTAPNHESHAEIRARCTNVMDPAALYTRMDSYGLSYGNSFRCLHELYVGRDEALARIRLSDDSCGNMKRYCLHPSVIESCLQVLYLPLQSLLGPGAYIIKKLVNLRLYHRPQEEFWVHARVVRQSADTGSKLTIVAIDSSNRRLFEIGDIRVATLPQATQIPAAFENSFFEVRWLRQDLSISQQLVPHSLPMWLILRDGHGLGASVARQLREQGNICLELANGDVYSRMSDGTYCLDPTVGEHWEQLFCQAIDGRACGGIVHCAALDGASWPETSDATLRRDLRRGVWSFARLAQAVLRHQWQYVPRLYVLTRAAQAVGPSAGPFSAVQSALWGIGRSLAWEHPNLKVVRIDLAATPHVDEATKIVRELAANSEEDQIGFVAGQRYVARLVRHRLQQDDAQLRKEPIAGRPFRLQLESSGNSNRLSLRPMRRRPLGYEDVEIKVIAAGGILINEMTDLTGLGREVASTGWECAGRIVGLGNAVRGLAIGQNVVAFATTEVGSHVVAAAKFVRPMPANVSYAQSATMLRPFMTAFWALNHVGNLQRGERILILAAATGTGLAAAQVSHIAGGEIYAIAKSDEQFEQLSALGIVHVIRASRSNLESEILAKTDGGRIDVIIGALSDDLASASLLAIASGGRLLSIPESRTSASGLKFFPPASNISFIDVDLDEIASTKPDHFGALLTDVVDRIADGQFKPLPTRMLGLRDADEALDFVASTRQDGELALNFDDPTAMLDSSAHLDALTIRADATYLVTGGLGGLGLSLAKWLVQQGAKHLALIGRSLPSAFAQSLIEELRGMGAEVRVLHADVSERFDVDKALRNIDRDMPPLRGVVHAAGLLDDRTLPEMSEQQFIHPMLPKVFGGFNMHQATRLRALDFFVVYSSGAALFGSPGQTNYAAANAFLDSLCRSRVSDGLPGMSIQWGTFADIGLAAAADVRGKRLASRGGANLTAEEGNQLLGWLLEHPRPEVGVVRADIDELCASFPQLAKWPYFSELIEAHISDSNASNEPDIVTRVRTAPGEAAVILLEEYLLTQIGMVLGSNASRIDRFARFSMMGMDSLTSLELRNRLESGLGVKLPATLMFSFPTPAALVEHLLSQLRVSEVGASEVSAPVPAPVTAEVSTASQEEQGNAERLLEAKIEAKLSALARWLD